MIRILWMRRVNPILVGSIFILIFGLILITFNLYKISILKQDFINLNNKAGRQQYNFLHEVIGGGPLRESAGSAIRMKYNEFTEDKYSPSLGVTPKPPYSPSLTAPPKSPISLTSPTYPSLAVPPRKSTPSYYPFLNASQSFPYSLSLAPPSPAVHKKNYHEPNCNQHSLIQSGLKYTVFGKDLDSGHLKHVNAVFVRAGYTHVSYNVSSNWNVMWAHAYPFRKIDSVMKSMKVGQKVSKFPGSGFVTKKINLATSGLDHIPLAWKIPSELSKLLEYSELNPDKLFVQKNNHHRGIKIIPLDKLYLKSRASFVQEFIQDPLLIDGYKFDIGVYTYITSIDPLRIYVYNGDCHIRFCLKKYHPFDQTDHDKYVIHGNYPPTWEVPTFAKMYSEFGYSFKETLNYHIRSVMGTEAPSKMWNTIHDIIRDVYSSKEKYYLDSINKYPHKRAFFELVRFDFILDSKMNIYLMEVNMSPNVRNIPQLRLLDEQVIYSLLRLVNVARPGLASSSSTLLPTSKEETEMQVSDKDIAVFSEMCSSQKCAEPKYCDLPECALCKKCLSAEEVIFLKEAFMEHVNKHSSMRVYPKITSYKEAVALMEQNNWNLSRSNQKMHQWFLGKCLMDEQWCN